MKSIVVHVLESVCAENNRDPEATALIEAARSFGTVETLENALASEKAKWQMELNKLVAQHEVEVKELKTKIAAIEQHELTADELEIVRALRAKSKKEALIYETEIKKRDDHLEAIMAECETRKQQIKSIYGL